MPVGIGKVVAPVLLPLATAAAVLALVSCGDEADDCTRVAARDGSDSARGTADRPFESAQKLVDSLEPGDVGCLREGTYREDVQLTRAGTKERPIRLQSFPGERAALVGEVAIRAGADHTTVAGLDLNGRNPNARPSPAISADHVTFEDNDVTNDHTAICFLVGTSPRARATVIRDNRIHDCGRLPARNREVGIYLQSVDGAQVLDNLIYDNADMGIQLYPDAQRTLIRGNVIDGNGEGIIFSGDERGASSGNVVEHNLITNARERNNVESYYDPGEPLGEHNVVRRNCIGGGADSGDGDGGISRQIGFSARDNVIADPGYEDREDFHIEPGSPCAEVFG